MLPGLGIDTAGGGFSGSSSADSRITSADRVDQRKIFNIGGAGLSTLQIALIAGAALLATYIIFRKK